MTDLWAIERSYFDRGIKHLCGCDEAGAGPLAGPVCAGAVMLPPFLEIPGLNDSKKLSAKKRDELYDIITRQSMAWSFAMVDENEIDEINILNARMLAMEKAINALSNRPEFALIDGNRNTGITVQNATVVKGDSLSASIAAASIIAKVTRDRYMDKMAEKYPQYAFEQHKGYGTKLHYQRLLEFGPTPIHRKTFLKNLEDHR